MEGNGEDNLTCLGKVRQGDLCLAGLIEDFFFIPCEEQEDNNL